MLVKSFFTAAIAATLITTPAVFAGHKNHNHDAEKHAASMVKHQSLVISASWARATVKTARVGAGYLVIKNTGDSADRLLSVTADFAGKSEVHEMKVVDNVMRMRPLVDGIEIPAGGEITLKPGAEHLMFMQLKKQLIEGEAIEATLVFEKAGSVAVKFDVRSAGAKHKKDDHNHGHKHDKKKEHKHDHS